MDFRDKSSGIARDAPDPFPDLAAARRPAPWPNAPWRGSPGLVSLLGPRLVVSGPMLDGPKPQFPASIAVSTPDDGRRAVAMLHSRGVDFIKLQSLVPRDAYFAIAKQILTG